MRPGQLAQRPVHAVLVVDVVLPARPARARVTGERRRREPVRVGERARERRVVRPQRRRVERIRQLVIIREPVVPAAQREHRRRVHHPRAVQHERVVAAGQVVLRARELVLRIQVVAVLPGLLPQVEPAHRHGVAEVVVDLQRPLIRRARQDVGVAVVLRPVVHLRLGLGEVAQNLRAGEVDPIRRNDVARERLSRERVDDGHERALARQPREVAADLGQRRDEVGALLRLVVRVLLAREPEERLVLHDRPADPAAAVAPVLRPEHLAVQLRHEQLLLQRRRPEHRVARERELVGARLRGHVHHAAARPPHLRIVGVDLDRRIRQRFHRRVDGRAVLQVRRREAVDQEVVRAHRAAAHRQRRVARLVLHPVPVRVAARHHRRLERRHQEHAPALGRQFPVVLRAERRALRGRGRLDERRRRRHRHVLLNGADFELDGDVELPLRGDLDILVLVGPVAGHLDAQGVGGGIDRRERILATPVGHGLPAGTGSCVDELNRCARDDTLGVGDRAAHGALKRLCPSRT